MAKTKHPPSRAGAQPVFNGPGMGVQHDNHIWVTMMGEGWAIRRIEHGANGPRLLHVWRGYWPNLEFAAINVDAVDWTSYCDKAVAFLAAFDPLDSLLEKRQ